MWLIFGLWGGFCLDKTLRRWLEWVPAPHVRRSDLGLLQLFVLRFKTKWSLLDLEPCVWSLWSSFISSWPLEVDWMQNPSPCLKVQGLESFWLNSNPNDLGLLWNFVKNLENVFLDFGLGFKRGMTSTILDSLVFLVIWGASWSLLDCGEYPLTLNSINWKIRLDALPCAHLGCLLSCWDHL